MTMPRTLHPSASFLKIGNEHDHASGTSCTAGCMQNFVAESDGQSGVLFQVPPPDELVIHHLSTANMPYDEADRKCALLTGGAALLHKKKNQAVYGNGTTAEAILDGKVPAPPEFQPLYDLLNELSARPTRPDE